MLLVESAAHNQQMDSRLDLNSLSSGFRQHASFVKHQVEYVDHRYRVGMAKIESSTTIFSFNEPQYSGKNSYCTIVDTSWVPILRRHTKSFSELLKCLDGYFSIRITPDPLHGSITHIG